jgi:hypothetical protein
LPGVLALRGALDHGKFLGHVESQVVFLGRATAKGVFSKIGKNLKIPILNELIFFDSFRAGIQAANTLPTLKKACRSRALMVWTGALEDGLRRDLQEAFTCRCSVCAKKNFRCLPSRTANRFPMAIDL